MSKSRKATGHQTLRMIRTQANWFEWGWGWVADFFLRPPTLKAGNFATLQPTDPILIV